MWGSKDVEVENGAHPYVKPEVRVEAQDTQTKSKMRTIQKKSKRKE